MQETKVRHSIKVNHDNERDFVKIYLDTESESEAL